MKGLVTRRPNSISLFDDFDQFFDNFFRDVPTRNTGAVQYPSVDIREEKDKYLLEADLPGFSDKDVNVHVENNVLYIESAKEENREDKGENYLVKERARCTFKRSFSLPEGVNVDAIKGEFKNGVLTLDVPKSPERQPKKIAVKLSS